MSKKLILSLGGVLATLLLAGVPSGAIAGEFTADCELRATCTATMTMGDIELEDSNGAPFTCERGEGTASITTNSSTGTMKVIFAGCRELATPFHFTCSNTSTAGRVEVNTLTSHDVYLEPEGETPGILLTGFNVTFTCSGFRQNTVTGGLIGVLQAPNCGTFQTGHSIAFERSAAGQQAYTQVTTAGPVFQLLINSDDGEPYIATSLTALLTINYVKDRVKLTC